MSMSDIIKFIDSMELGVWKNIFISSSFMLYVIFKVVKPNRIMMANRDLILYAEKVLINKRTVRECIKELSLFKKFLVKDKSIDSELFLPNEIIINKAICRLIVNSDKHPSEWEKRMELAKDCFLEESNERGKNIRKKYLWAFVISWVVLAFFIFVCVLFKAPEEKDVYCIYVVILSFVYCFVGFLIAYIFEHVISSFIIRHT